MTDICKCGGLYKSDIASAKYAHVHLRTSVTPKVNYGMRLLKGYSAAFEKRVSKMTCCICITLKHFLAIGHQVIAAIEFVAFVQICSDFK
jgi:hypothetical protein